MRRVLEFLIRPVSFLGGKVPKVLKLILLTLMGRKKYDTMVNRLFNSAVFRFIFYLLSDVMLVWPQKNFFALVRLLGGVKLAIPDLPSIPDIHEVWREGVYERGGEKLAQNQVVFDVGAHVGIYSVKASREVGQKGMVVAIEPHPDNFKLLLKNLELNRCTNVTPLNVALSSSCGELSLFLSNWSTAHSTRLRSNNLIKVEATTLDELTKELGLKAIDFIKLNVEGAALEVLKGAEEVLRLYKPQIAIEAGHYPEEMEGVIRFLSDRGFLTSTWRYFVYAKPRSAEDADK